MGQFYDIANQALLFTMFAVSLNLLMGFAGQASIAHAAFGAIGAYTAGVLGGTHGWPFLAVLLAGIVIAGVAGLVVSLPALRLSNEYTILLTLSVAFIVSTLVQGIDALGGQFGLRDVGQVSFLGIEVSGPRQFFPLLLVLAAVVFVSCWRMGESAFGRVLRALREDEDATRAIGKNTVKFKLLVFGATSGMAGLAGVMWAYYYQQVSPTQWTLHTAITIMAMIVIGGLGNLVGSVLGAIFVVISTPILEDWVDIDPTRATFAQLIIYGSALILLMMFRPEGLIRERHHKVSLEPTDDEPVRAPAGAREQRSPSTVSAAAVSEPPGVDALVVHDLHKAFGGIKAVDGVSLELPSGEVTALIGPNGAGKSTLFGLFTGFMEPDAGTVDYRGASLLGRRPDQIARRGVVRSFQDTRLFRQMTVFSNVVTAVPGQRGENLLELFGRPLAVRSSDAEARERAMEQLRVVGMLDKANTVAGDLAHGEQKLVAIARALATGADLLLFDEPTSGIDEQGVGRIAQTVARLPEHGKTVCIVEHNLAFLEQLGVPCYFLEMGTVRTKGSLQELMADPALRDAYFAT